MKGIAMPLNDPKPSDLRLTLAFFFAALVPSIVVGALAATATLFDRLPRLAPEASVSISWLAGFAAYGLAALFVGAFLTGIGGTVAYFILRQHVAPRLRWAVLTGALLASVPYAAFVISLLLPGVDEPILPILGGGLLGCGLLAALGALGGAVFWGLLRPGKSL